MLEDEGGAWGWRRGKQGGAGRGGSSGMVGDAWRREEKWALVGCE